MQELIHVLYDNIDENDIVYATKNKEKDKTDITIIINSIEKNLSLKDLVLVPSQGGRGIRQ